jgi:hypothetical protein
MKILKYSIRIIVITALSVACDSSHLDLKPLADTEADYFDKQIDFERAVRGIYAKFTDFYWYNNNFPIHKVWLLPGDDLTTTGSYPFEVFTTLQPGDGDLNTFYQACYRIISRANTLLQKIEEDKGKAKSAYGSTVERDINQGEALFLRGYANFLLWNFFGYSPLVTERIQTQDKINPPNSEGTQLLDQAITDFTSASELLPASWDAENTGRVTKSSANGMLGKAYIFRATWNGTSADYTSAITAINKITDKQLLANYGDNFSILHENSSESLFEFQADQPSFDNVWLSNDFGQGVGTMSCYRGFFNDHWSFWEHTPFVPTAKFTALVTSVEYTGDPRIPYIMDVGTNRIMKYMIEDQLSQSGVASVNNERILRYSDVLLLKAEAMNETGDQPGAIALINTVRTRARNMDVTGKPADRATGASQDQVRSWIMEERFIELAAEGHRWDDLRRWHKAGFITLNSAYFNSLNASINFDPTKHLLDPIPTSETDLNPNVKQNPGY